MPKGRNKEASQPTTQLTARLHWTILALSFLIYSAVFIYQTSFVVDGVRYFSLFDDAMIAMQYGRNLAAGHGLVWNPGERVEGFTNPLWVVFMAGLHFLPVSVSKISLFVQIASAGCLLVNLVLVKRMSERLTGRSDPSVLFAGVLVAFFYPLNNWSLRGMEVGLLASFVCGATLLALQEDRSAKRLHLLYGLLAAGTLIRMDAAVVCVTCCLFLAWREPESRGKHLAYGFGWLATLLALQTGARWFYYGELLPNTYYAKIDGYPAFDRMRRGAAVLLKSVYFMNPLLILAPFVFALTEKRKGLPLLAWVVAAQVAYSVYVGGDAWEDVGGPEWEATSHRANRYLTTVSPLFFVMFSFTVFQLAGKLKKFESRRIVLLLLVPLSLVSFNWRYSRQGFSEWTLTSKPGHFADDIHWVRLGLTLKEITKPDATIGVVWAGAIPYFSERRARDFLGKSDKVIARLPARRLEMGFWPGHMKWDYSYSIGRLQPDVIAQLWLNRDEAYPFVKASYIDPQIPGLGISVRRDSPNIDWEKVEKFRAKGNQLTLK